jgi:tRNA modification GTPase
VFSTSDTIVAVATPLGRGAVGMVRISGAGAFPLIEELTGRRGSFLPRRATLCRLTLGGDEGLADEVLVTCFPAPDSYTGEDVVEIAGHGSPLLLTAMVRAACAAGARLAEPGEFTLRSVVLGKRDLVQAEAVADLIDAVTPAQARAAFEQLDGTLSAAIGRVETRLFEVRAALEASLDFPDEGYHFITPDAVRQGLDEVAAEIGRLLATSDSGRLIREGALVVLAGAPNAGKSSLFNALVNAPRAIVTAVPGTTRDVLSERVVLDGLAVTLVDTAGDRVTTDAIEQEGVARARHAARAASLVLVVIDGSRPRSSEDEAVLSATMGQPRIVVVNKCDAERVVSRAWPDEDEVVVSARTGEGVEKLRAAVMQRLGLGAETQAGDPLVTNARHVLCLERSQAAVARAVVAARTADGGGVPEEFLVADIDEAQRCLQEVTGARSSDDVLAFVFSRFCLGK